MELSEFSEIYLPLSQPLYRVALYFLENEDDACDVVQDLYLKIWNVRDTLDFVHNPKAYCITMIRNLCLDRIRMAGRIGGTQKAGKITEQHPPDCSSSGDDPQGLLENKETLQQIINAIQHLPDKQRTVLRMKIFEDLSYDEISRRTGMNIITLRVLLCQARARLKQVKLTNETTNVTDK